MIHFVRLLGKFEVVSRNHSPYEISICHHSFLGKVIILVIGYSIFQECSKFHTASAASFAIFFLDSAGMKAE